MKHQIARISKRRVSRAAMTEGEQRFTPCEYLRITPSAMKASITLLLMLGWYLMGPPKIVIDGSVTYDFNAPVSKWLIIQTFDSAQECQEWKANADEELNSVRPTVDLANCIASDDPRLAPE